MVKNKLNFGLTVLMSSVAIMACVLMCLSYTTADDSLDGSSDNSEIIVPSYDVKIIFDVETITNGNVVAKFVTTNKDIEIVNNEGKDTYTFFENGDFTFEYIIKSTGDKGSIVAHVDWIDKVLPTASIIYDYSTYTNNSVKATLVPSEEVTILNNEYEILDELGNTIIGDPREHIFADNGEFTFIFEDKAGNRGSAVARVDWIDKTVPIATLNYNEVNKTSSPVKVEISFDEDNVTILNNEGKNYFIFNENGEFIFEFMDKAGNLGNAKAMVNWIEKKTNMIENESNNNKPNKGVSSNNQAQKDNIKDTHKDEKNAGKTFKIFSVSNIELEIDVSLVEESIVIKKELLTMSDELLNRFNKNCEYFLIKFENKNGEVVNLDLKDNSTLTVLLDGTKTFKNVYSINDNEKVQIVDFKVVNGNKAEIKGAGTGKYLVEYEEIINNNSSNNLLDIEEESDNSQLNAAIVICSCVIGAVLLMVLVCVLIKNY